MKVAEIKGKIEGYKARPLRRLVVEMYKAMPKSVKEAQRIDDLICNPAAGRKKQNVEVSPSMALLRLEAQEFISNAYNQCYYGPNSVVPKRERSKWRFVALRLFKQLQQAAGDPENAAEASGLLEQLYGMLCYSCYYILFSAYDPFQSVGIAQADFLHAVLRAKRETENPRDFVRNGILLALGHGLNRYTLYEQLMEVVVGFLTTPDLKQLAIAACDEIRRSVEKDGLPRLHAGKWQNEGSTSYGKQTMLENLAKMGFMCHMALFEHDDAVDYFQRYNIEKDAEIALYVLVRMIEHYGNKDLLIKVYERAVANGVHPRQSLKELYGQICQGRDFPD